jgi:hypothetical protein
MVVIFPLTVPKVKGQYIHDLGSAQQEDGGPNDADGMVNQIVVWANDNDHFISNVNYLVESGYTLDIQGLPVGYAIYFQDPAVQLTVDRDAKLITHDNGDPFSRTTFIGSGPAGFDSIMFNPNSEGRIVDCEIQNSLNGVIFFGANLMYPGIYDSLFTQIGAYGVQMNMARNYTNIARTTFDDSASPSAVCLDVRNGSLNLTDQVAFIGHSSISPSVYVSNANVTFNYTNFNGFDMQGNCLVVEGASNGTVLNSCDFQGGAPGDYYVKSNGASFLMDNCTFFQEGSSTGALTLEAHDLEYDIDVLYSAHVILRNPINVSGDWDNSSIEATGDSSVTLQWWIDVEVRDRDGHNIAYVPVYVKDRLGNPGSPPTRMTDSNGWARWFLITELIQYESTIDNFNPYDISAQNGSLWGYADFENSTITRSRDVLVIVPSSPPSPPTPPPPTELSAELTGSAWNVTLSWNASLDDGAGEDDIAGYTVYKSSTGINGTYEFAAWIPANGSPSYLWTDFGAGDGNWNNYLYIVRANDTSDNEEQNTDKAGKFVKFLFKDWNLISIPLIQTNTSRDHVLRTLEDNYFSVQGYHAGKSRPWLHWFKGKPHYFNDAIEIDHKNGYYVGMKNPDYLVVAGRVPSSTQIQLKTGWNLVGYQSMTNRTRDDALSSIAGNYNMVLYFDTKLKKEIRLNPDDYMEPGLGYWIHATADCELEISN